MQGGGSEFEGELLPVRVLDAGSGVIPGTGSDDNTGGLLALPPTGDAEVVCCRFIFHETPENQG
jgi:hypothetical protein